MRSAELIVYTNYLCSAIIIVFIKLRWFIIYYAQYSHINMVILVLMRTIKNNNDDISLTMVRLNVTV